MTRNRKVDPEVLEREYIYDSGSPPISLTQLAERHGLARSGVADKAMRGQWFRKREEFRQQLGEKAVEKLGEEWVRFETAVREKVTAIGLKYLTKFEAAMDDPEFKVSTRDMLGIAAMLRAYIGDAAAAKTNGEEVALYDPDTADLDPAIARRVLAELEAGPLGPPPAPSTAEPGED